MNNDIKRLKDLSNKIINLNPKIRYAGIISPYGKTLAGKIKPAIKPYFKTEEAMNEFFITAVREMLRKTFENSLGKHILTLTMHEKVNAITFSIEGYILYITFERDASLDEMLDIVNRVRELFNVSS